MKMTRKTYNAVGSCIYCGSDQNLSLEHVIPEGLGGQLELPSSSCDKCAVKTSQFERIILRNELLPVRSALSLRKKKKRTPLRNVFPVEVKVNGIKSVLNLDAKDLPAMIPLLFLDLPGKIRNDSMENSDMKVTGFYSEHATTFYSEALRKIYIPSTNTVTYEISQAVDHDVHIFGRVLAKIALGFAVGELSIENKSLKENFIREVILGTSDSVGYWVGSNFYARSLESKELHALKMDIIDSEVHVKIQLFAQSGGSPVYTVIVGRV
jgi:HNH endonuclease